MKRNLLLLFLAGASHISTTLAASRPLCSVDCFADSLLQSSCPQTDKKCLCESTRYLDAALECIQMACKGNDLQQAYKYWITTCESVSVPVSIPGLTSTTSTIKWSATISVESIVPTSVEPHTTSAIQTETVATTESTALPDTNTDNNKTPIGLVAGGVAGGVAVVAALLGGFMLFRRMKRKQPMGYSEETSTKPFARPDPNSQSIWTGEESYSWKPTPSANTSTNDMGNDMGGIQGYK
ncbi:hypothetical protein H072_6621 [Dactylellina haptotyla CBS 200.50]|uniref:CFEM domain-containing protein n=1 Tax=Dactylellina haptotyla (strain CBS 200.50) TaxID=1284197 RepID=S8A8Z5_DACHA|nr:hypothetical protein H072_6621 [Dactylellina haptotyla CBS 200.50]